MKILVSVSIIILTVSVIFTCFYQQFSSKRDKELVELKAIQQKQELDNTYFELLSHQNEELQVFVHDTKNHLNNICNLLGSSELVKDYISNIVDDIDSVNRIGKTTNKLLDLIIDKYNYICEKNGVTFLTNIHKANLDFISNNDFTSLFNNLLDNAVEAAKVSDKKRISLNINIIGNMLHIEVTNSCDKPPVSYNKILISTKDNKQFHGYGFKSITRTVKKYKGDIEWDYDDKQQEFLVSILLAYNN
jgi:sensor histidine kinase regulating citrate/malate metabolism